MSVAHIPFSEDDEAKIASAATWGSIVSITSLVGGGLSLLTTAIGSAGASTPEQIGLGVGIFAQAFLVLINVWLLQACQAFRKVALTNEADQAYLLAGFRKLRGYFMLQVLMILLSIGFAILAGLFAAAMF